MKFKIKTDVKFKNETERYFHDLSYMCYLSGYPNLWIKELPVSKTFQKYYRVICKIIEILVAVLFLLQFGALYTQTNLSPKQQSDLRTFCFTHPMVWGSRLIIIYHRREIKKLYADILAMKDIYNNLDLEKKMIKKGKYLSNVFLKGGYSLIILNTINSALWSIKTGEPFMSLCTAWPLKDDRSTAAYVGRAVIYVMWWLFVNRALASFSVVVSLNSAMSYQFENLHSYFLSLGQCFNLKTDQKEMYKKFEEAFITGIKLQNLTVSCTRVCYDIFKWILQGVTIYAITVQVVTVLNMSKAERTLDNMVPLVFAAALSYAVSGTLVCSTGDINVEASKLDKAIFGSGWHNCSKESLRRIKGLIILAMCRAQEPLVFTAYGFLEISYESYIKELLKRFEKFFHCWIAHLSRMVIGYFLSHSYGIKSVYRLTTKPIWMKFITQLVKLSYSVFTFMCTVDNSYENN